MRIFFGKKEISNEDFNLQRNGFFFFWRQSRTCFLRKLSVAGGRTAPIEKEKKKTMLGNVAHLFFLHFSTKFALYLVVMHMLAFIRIKHGLWVSDYIFIPSSIRMRNFEVVG